MSPFLLVLVLSVGVASSAPAEVAYGEDPAQRLDLTVPADKNFATVIFIHGGSLTGGDKGDADYANVCKPFPAAGIACASVNYRLAPKHAWPAQAEDVAAAVVWVRDHIGARGGDPRRLFLVGHSSGALLAALLAADERYLGRYGMKPGDLAGVVPMGSIMWDAEFEQALEEHGRDAVAAVFAHKQGYAFYGSIDAYLDHWPIRHVSRGMPPLLFLVAEGEREHPPVLATNREFVEEARALGNRAEWRVLPGRSHYSAIRLLHEPGDAVFAIVRDFVRGSTAGAER